MIRENQKYFNTFQVLLDLFFVACAYILAHYIRFYILDGGQSLSERELLLPLIFILPIYFVLYHLFDLYSPKRTKSLVTESIRIFQTNVITVILLMTGLFLFKIVNFSRGALVLFFIINVCLTSGSRLLIRVTLRNYRKRGYNLKHCLLVGTTSSSQHFIKKVYQHPDWGYSILGILGEQDALGFTSITYLGTVSELATILETKRLDMVIIGVEGNDLEQLATILHTCEKSGVKTQIIPYYHQYIPAKPYMDDLDGLPVIDIRHVPLDNLFKNSLKRAFDIFFALCAIIVTGPLMLLAAIITKYTSPGPILFKQERIGLDRKPFAMYKFRSMRVQTASEEQAQWTTQDDPRKTKWGTFMRKTSIDELPQFFNVLKGDMSVVGPRPERPFFVEQFKETIPRYMIKHQVRPGITGWAQVNGLRGDTSIEERITHDLYYIENWTFSMDIKIILLTLLKGFINQNAY